MNGWVLRSLGWLVGFFLVVCESPEEEGNEGLAGLICQRWRLVSRRGALGRVKWLLGASSLEMTPTDCDWARDTCAPPYNFTRSQDGIQQTSLDT